MNFRRQEGGVVMTMNNEEAYGKHWGHHEHRWHYERPFN